MPRNTVRGTSGDQQMKVWSRPAGSKARSADYVLAALLYPREFRPQRRKLSILASTTARKRPAPGLAVRTGLIGHKPRSCPI